MFKIVCCGWRCPDWVRVTLDSIAHQHLRDFEVMISYESDDPIESGFQKIEDWVSKQPDRGKYHMSFREGRENFLFGSQARYRAIEALAPADDDVIIWLNIDGDRFAHPQVLNRVWDSYFLDGFPLVTYGSFLHVPDEPNPLVAKPYDNAVIAHRSYREAPFCAADLRTMQYRVWKNIPAEQHQWSDGHSWYSKIDDMTSMIPALELVGLRHRFVPEVLMIYNILNPLSGVKVPGVAEETTAHIADFRAKKPLDQVF